MNPRFIFGILLVLLVAISPVGAAVPGLVTPANDATNVPFPVTLGWEAVQGVTQYECDIARDAEFNDSVLRDHPVTGTSLTVYHLLPATRYFWHVRTAANEAWSPTQSFTTTDAVPSDARSGRIVFACADDIYVMNGDGSQVTALPRKGPLPSDPDFSPDGRHIVFLLGDQWAVGSGGVFYMDADGSGCRKLCQLPGRAWRPTFSPDGTTVLFAFEEDNGQQRHLCTIKTDGSDFTRLPVNAGMMSDPAYFPDGKTIITANGPITLFNPDGSKRGEISNPDRIQHQYPSITPDGTILFSSAFTNGKMSLMAINISDSGEVCLATANNVGAPAISPDGNRIIYFTDKAWHYADGDGQELSSLPTPAQQWISGGVSWRAAAGRWQPEPPTLVSPSDHATNQPVPVQLHWTPLIGVTGYAVQVASDPQFLHIISTCNPVYGDVITIDKLKANTRYFWRMRAVFRNEAGDWSATRSFTTASMLPPKMINPADRSLSVAISTSLSWETVAHAKAYHLQIARDAEFSQIVQDKAGLADAGYRVEQLSPATRYWWRVAIDGGPWSAARTLVTTNHPVPYPLTPQPMSENISTPVRLSWVGVPGATAYDVQVGTDERLLSLAVNTRITETAFTLPTLNPNSYYQWRVRAVFDGNLGFWCTPVYFRTGAQVTPQEPAPALHGHILLGMEVDNQCALYCLQPDGQNFHKLTDVDLGVWSINANADGSRLVTSENGYSTAKIYVMNSDGSARTTVTPDAIPNGEIALRCPVFTPDGTSIVYAVIVNDRGPNRGANLWVMDLDGRHARQIPNSSTEDILSLTVTPDGSHVVWNTFGGKDMFRIYSMKLDGTDKRTVLDKFSSKLCVTPDGKRVIATQHALWSVGIDGTGYQELSEEGDSYLAASPDGQYLVTGFYDTEDEKIRVCVMRSDGSQRTTIYSLPWKSENGIYSIAWVPDQPK